MGSFWAKYTLFELKRYRGLPFYDSEEWCKVWRNIELWFGKWQEFVKFFLEWDTLIQSRKCMSLQFTEKLSVMTKKNDAKLGEELTCRFKIDMRDLTNFDTTTQEFKNFSKKFFVKISWELPILRINVCLSTPKMVSFPLQLGQEQNILGQWFERGAYRFVSNATKVWYSLFLHTDRVDRGWWTLC